VRVPRRSTRFLKNNTNTKPTLKAMLNIRISPIIFFTLITSLPACDSRAGSTGSDPESSTTSDGETSGPATTGGSSGTMDHQTGCEEASSQVIDTDADSGSETSAPTTGAEASECVPFRVGACSPGASWCSDLFAMCVSLSLENVSPNFCAGLAIVCEAGSVAPCEICSGVTEQCVLSGRPAGECDAFAKTCACLVDAHGI
jgi:hypothetical protein